MQFFRCREHHLEKIAVYLSRCGLQSNSELVEKGYPDLGWDPVEGERYLDFLRFCVWVGGRPIEKGNPLVFYSSTRGSTNRSLFIYFASHLEFRRLRAERKGEMPRKWSPRERKTTTFMHHKRADACQQLAGKLPTRKSVVELSSA